MTATKEAVLNWRQSLKTEHANLESQFFSHQNTPRLLKKLSHSIDHLLAEVWQQLQLHPDICLIAVGGYGRQTLFPYSDIDLLILQPEDTEQDQQAKIESLIGILWDIGLNVGHSVRTHAECLEEAQRDVTILTNLIESRLIIGPQKQFQLFQVEVNNTLAPASFLEKKLKEQQNRHAKFNDTAYNLEPNLKESPGGLRDLNMILWIAQSQGWGKTWAELRKNNIISDKELRQIKRHELNLQTLRVRLHYLAKRREDRLLFDFQNELAADLGFVTTPHKRASEQLMHRYYQSVKYISLMNEILLKTFQENLANSPARITEINRHFYVQHGLLHANIAHIFQLNPAAIFESFLLLQQHQSIQGFGADLIRELQRVKKSINHDFRQSSVHKALFLEILSQPDGVNRALRNMNRYGVLGQYIPVFGKIIGQMQHDLFHVYTVDEHILNVLRNLRRFAKPELAHEFPLCSKLFAHFDKPYLLYLAALFHDIAKGRGGDHSDLGTIDARRFCKLHGLQKAETELVAWLVQAHLKMSSTAQKSDLSDPKVIEQFAQFVKDEYRLTALYLLTVADIRGTSPVVWNAWKARLLESLYFSTTHILRAEHKDSLTQIEIRKQEVSKKLASFNLSQSSAAPLWESFGEQYFTRFDSDEIAWQSRLLMPHKNTLVPIVRARLSPKGDGIQVMIYAKDRNDIFARICHFFDSMHYNIAQAKIFTTQHGYALDNFIVLEQSTKQVSYSGLLNHIEATLTAELIQNGMLEKPIQGRMNRQVKHMPINTQVQIFADSHNQYHQLEIIANDRPGLLAQMAQILLSCHIELRNANINTLGNRVEDHFLISAPHGKKLNVEAIKNLEAAFSQL
ncbi:(protein-PII) uridylyltransferase [Methylophilaceae bacterium 11]|jgi:[protein-PII] uridylyltransferase|uniref:[protein-PII] uridylyltransferase n=1 Tax=Methylotenera sp. 1P/1 TaxID=1131551 RepID=UPI0003825BED|nr:[protein-PII] uridylyltransferase [Methylotenera sp. 1P/1]EUJ10377.1 (protein-PII) uridylyltransferase [Methylophilaceae bacterium 11]